MIKCKNYGKKTNSEAATCSNCRCIINIKKEKTSSKKLKILFYCYYSTSGDRSYF